MRARLLSSAALLSLLPLAAHAQDYERIAPRVPAPAEAPSPVPPPAAPAPMPASNAVILPTLKGLVFLPGADKLQPAGLSATGIAAPGVKLLDRPDFAARLASHLGRALTFAGLDAIVAETDAWYREHDRPFVAVTVPPQNVSSGTVQIVVTEYRLGSVKAAGNRWFSSSLIEEQSGLAPGQSLTLGQAQSSIDGLNENPFRQVDAVFSPGTAAGTTDLTLQTADRLPVHVYSSFDNQGVPSLGRDEWGVGGSWGNVGGLGHILSYQFTRSVSGRYDAQALNYTIPLPWQDRLVVFGSYATQHPDAGADFDETGKSGQASLRYLHNLPRIDFLPGVSLRHDVQIGYDFKTTDSDLEFGGSQVFASEVEIDQFPLVYDATLTDPWGQTAFQNTLVLSPGGITGANDGAAFKQAVPGSSASYVYDTIGLTRTTFLPHRFSWITRVLGQVANHNLMYSEQLGLGGMNSVRGYATDAALGSQGVLVSNELRTPPFGLGALTGLKLPAEDAQQLGVFLDYGHVAQVRAIPDAVHDADLASAGVDLHIAIDRYAELRFDTGWRLCVDPGGNKRGGFTDFTITLGY